MTLVEDHLYKGIKANDVFCFQPPNRYHAFLFSDIKRSIFTGTSYARYLGGIGMKAIIIYPRENRTRSYRGQSDKSPIRELPI